MLRIKVGGKITETTGGNVYNYAKGDITYSSAIEVIETAPEIVYGNAEPHPEREKIEVECLTLFRPGSHWMNSPEYGFDWIRTGDSGLQADYPFKDIMGKYYDSNGELSKDGNKVTSDFRKNPQMYQKLVNSFRCIPVNWKQQENEQGQKETYKYPVPVLTLLTGRSATLNLKLEIQKPPQQLTFEFESLQGTEYYSLSTNRIDKIETNVYDLKDYLTITSLKECDQWQTLKVKADGELCGMLSIHPNSKKYQSSLKIALIKVKTDINGEVPEVEYKPEEIDILTGVLNQALIIPEIVEEPEYLDCTGEEFKTTYASYGRLRRSGENGYKITGNQNRLKSYLVSRCLKQYHKKYENHVVIFFIEEEAFEFGFSPMGSKVGINFKDRMNDVPTHEILHGLSLPHSFDSNSLKATYTYRQMKTHNVMDYSSQRKIPSNCLFLWQWQILNNKIKSNK